MFSFCILKQHNNVSQSQYKSLLGSHISSAVDIVTLVIRCNCRADDPQLFTLHELCSEPYSDRPLRPDEKPLSVQVRLRKTTFCTGAIKKIPFLYR